MNAALAYSVPPVAIASVQLAPANDVDVDALHQELIRGCAALNDTVLEDLSTENVSIMLELVDRFRVDLLQVQAAAGTQAVGGATG